MKSILMAGVGLALTAAPALAQDDTAANVAEESGEIVVTAQKRSESIQSVPISIAAFSGATLEKANVTNVLDLGRIATNFSTVRSSNTGSTRIGIRGVGSLANTLIEPSVAVFLDGVYVPRSGSILGSFLDIAGVEVLRGPQGTLFGRNASVGALSLRSALPRNEFSGEVAGEVGSFDRYKLSGHVNVPLGENVAMRLAGMGQWYKGPWHNRLDDKTYGGSDDVSLARHDQGRSRQCRMDRARRLHQARRRRRHQFRFRPDFGQPRPGWPSCRPPSRAAPTPISTTAR